MACPTCDHTMQSIAGPWLWCPRCGTLKDRSLDDTVTNHEAPKLVERCRVADNILLSMGLLSETDWHRLGIAESINLPKDRPQSEAEYDAGPAKDDR